MVHRKGSCATVHLPIARWFAAACGVGCMQVTVRKGDSIGVFLKAVREQLAPQFRELRAVSVDNMMYIKVGHATRQPAAPAPCKSISQSSSSSCRRFITGAEQVTDSRQLQTCASCPSQRRQTLCGCNMPSSCAAIVNAL
jgi:hypothetical protein